MTGTVLDEVRSDGGGQLLANLMYFGRTLREAGLPVGPGKVLAAAEAVCQIGLTNRTDFYWTLHAVFVNRRDQGGLFDQAFHIFWRNPQLLERLMGMLLPEIKSSEVPPEAEISRRLAEALGRGAKENSPQPPEAEFETDAAMTFSHREILQKKDFEAMSAEEFSQVKNLIRHMALPLANLRSRRFEADPRGARVDMRATLRASLRADGWTALRRKSLRIQPPPLVILCDISGSMSRYSRLFLHFMHAVTNDRDRVHTFLFGTRLTNVTRHLKYKDVDIALDKVAATVEDWSGGTRIGESLAEFNRFWSRRVLAQGAVVLLITDGLDREGGLGVAREMDRLHRSCRRLVWLNPLLRFAGFEPKSLGIKAILPHVDEFRPIHNLESLGALIDALSQPATRRLEAAAAWHQKEAAA